MIEAGNESSEKIERNFFSNLKSLRKNFNKTNQKIFQNSYFSHIKWTQVMKTTRLMMRTSFVNMEQR